MPAKDGDGWVECSCGARHWGRNGAAGIVILNPTDRTVLMQLRAEWTHGGQTWAFPGGARDSHETSQEAALRELYEELGIASDAVEIVHGNTWTDHGDWHYHTVIATAHNVMEFVSNEESVDVRWVHIDQVTELELHPGVASVWPEVSVAIVSILDAAQC